MVQTACKTHLAERAVSVMRMAMAEHVPSRFLIALMALFFGVMTLFAATFWVLSVLWPGGPGGLIASISPTAVAIVGTLHIPAAIVGILLLQWHRKDMPPVLRVTVEAATVYFGLLVLISIALNYMAASLLDLIG
jgi:hypothetical protein